MESPYKIKVEPKAKDDLREAVAYYLSVAPPKIAKNFLKEYLSIKDFIKHFLTNINIQDLIGVPMKKDSYLVFYKVDDTKREIIIKAIFNTYQDTSKYPE
jgi:plasmid stabilization system protein, relE/parE family